MPVLNAEALSADPQGMEFLRDVLGTQREGANPDRRFPLEAWTPKAATDPAPKAPIAPETLDPRCVEPAL